MSRYSNSNIRNEYSSSPPISAQLSKSSRSAQLFKSSLFCTATKVAQIPQCYSRCPSSAHLFKSSFVYRALQVVQDPYSFSNPPTNFCPSIQILTVISFSLCSDVHVHRAPYPCFSRPSPVQPFNIHCWLSAFSRLSVIQFRKRQKNIGCACKVSKFSHEWWGMCFRSS